MGTGDIRVGTSDRERAIGALADHLAAGRLEVAEYEQRVGTAAAARTRADLLALFDDLPDPHPDFDGPPHQRPAVVVAEEEDRSLWEPQRSRNTKTGLYVFLGVATAGVVAVVAITATWWALAPILIVGLLLLVTS
ncbi:DUF1707 domain-containing protein [Actinokineospora sp. NBRC 105648]|uniref:DUF1707 SHOCT-like domain-containing protein n=1 Tax=Actinokineospora sp. NBRC 105648 TaxID=3032206 RepID=UPI0024A1B4B3|nr:DUF1707 domain-containing protein [Actinokineospora sp. NBRC 105648]GLZ36417.1 hypothetical protein Acsp05_00420 [Actinokineospora sp. NBRC 105648]